MLKFDNYDHILEKITNGLLHNEAPSCWNILIPPEFGEYQFCDDLNTLLRSHLDRPLVACISADNLTSREDYKQQLALEWSCQLPSPLKEEINNDKNATIESLISSLPKGRPVIQIVNRFHKLQDTLDQWILGTLRRLEQSYQLRSVIVSAYSYKELKDKWQGLTISDYGHNHSVIHVKPCPINHIKHLLEGKIPSDLIEYAYNLSGGYPEIFNEIIKKWKQDGRKGLREDVLLDLRSKAIYRIARFIEWLDTKPDNYYKNKILEIYLGNDTTDAVIELQYHPWSFILIENGRLKSDVLGPGVIENIISEAIRHRDPTSILKYSVIPATKMYWNKNYEACLRCLEGIKPNYNDFSTLFLKVHAETMKNLYDSNRNLSGIDSQWSKIKASIDRAKILLNTHEDKIKTPQRLHKRYLELEKLSDAILKLNKLHEIRVVDVLAGLNDQQKQYASPEIAASLMALAFESCKAIPQNIYACQIALPLPEQIYRVWALWGLNINYYSAPDGVDDVWEVAEINWNRGKLERSTPQREFVSFQSFVHFSWAYYTLKGKQLGCCSSPEPDLQKIRQSLSLYSEIRLNPAHAICIINQKNRKNYFSLINRWLDAAIAVCPKHVIREELTQIVQPLPIVEKDGALTWGN